LHTNYIVNNSFASNGKYTVTGSNNYYEIRIIKNSDNSIYFTYAKDNPSLGSPECVVSKLNVNGTIDTSFGNNGKFIKTVQENNTNISELPKGIYIVKVKFENGKSATKKIIKN
jgi:hypothetical protein